MIGLVTLGMVSDEYDAFGNMVKETVTSYSAGTATSSLVTEYAVDGWNPAKAGAIGNSAFDDWAVLGKNSGGTFGLQTRNVQGNGIDQILARVDNTTYGASGTGLYLDLTDRLGSVRDVLNSAGTSVSQASYDAWGNQIGSPSIYQGMYGWDGYDYDAATNLYRDNARFYDPQSQRWMSQDPLGFDAGDSNLYRYVNNAPTNATDPSGEYLFASNANLADTWIYHIKMTYNVNVIKFKLKDGSWYLYPMSDLADMKKADGGAELAGYLGGATKNAYGIADNKLMAITDPIKEELSKQIADSQATAKKYVEMMADLYKDKKFQKNFPLLSANNSSVLYFPLTKEEKEAYNCIGFAIGRTDTWLEEKVQAGPAGAQDFLKFLDKEFEAPRGLVCQGRGRRSV